MRSRLVKVSDEEYEMLNNAKTILQEIGLEKLPPAPKMCPKCNSELETTSIGYSYLKCPSCDYKHYLVSVGSNNDEKLKNIALGGIIALGAAGLIYLLTKK